VRSEADAVFVKWPRVSIALKGMSLRGRRLL
jgi:hypothetical protein